MAYMYTIYTDIFNKVLLPDAIQKQTTRDNILLAKMKQNNIAMFPMSSELAENTYSFFENITTTNQLLNILIIHRNKTIVESCNLIINGSTLIFYNEQEVYEYISGNKNPKIVYNKITLKVDENAADEILSATNTLQHLVM
jgi:hypothetical protein